jgi:formylglycine-generating enzyme required for sulfatase activity
MLPAMRRLLLLLSALLLIFSCATTDQEEPTAPEPTEPEAVAIEVEPEVTEVEQEEVEEPEPEQEPEPAPEPEPEPVTLSVIEPADLAALESPLVTFSLEASSGELQFVELLLLEGPIAIPGSAAAVDASLLPEEDRSITLDHPESGLALRLPAGVVDGSTYRYRLRGVLADGTVTESEERQTLLSLGLETPVLGAIGRTIDTTPEIVVENVDDFREVEIRIEGGGDAIVLDGSGGRAIPRSPLSAGYYNVTARALTEDGYLTTLSDSQPLVVLASAATAPAWPVGGEASLTSSVGLQWFPVPGAVTYDVRYREAGDTAWQTIEGVATTYSRLPDLVGPGTELEWQVRALNDAGEAFAWSRTALFQAGTLDIEFKTIIASGTTAVFTRGHSNGSSDESPARSIELAVPYEMSETPLTNQQVAQVVNYALDRGLAVADEQGVRRTADDEAAIIGLGEMDYGVQFGLRLDASGYLESVPGYEDHPAIGISWHGAVAIASFLSYVEGRAPVYSTGEDGTVQIDPSADGYRLPTEAEWEYAARGTTTQLYPWGDELDSRHANYYRSFDPFEDVNEPFTGAGGPTNPVRYFPGDASPFGVRDLVGNVWEWCWDRYDPGYYADSSDVDPTGPDRSDFGEADEVVILAVALDPDQRVVRGTAWNSRVDDVRLTNRGRYSDDGLSYSIGVRLVRSP